MAANSTAPLVGDGDLREQVALLWPIVRIRSPQLSERECDLT